MLKYLSYFKDKPFTCTRYLLGDVYKILQDITRDLIQSHEFTTNQVLWEEGVPKNVSSYKVSLFLFAFNET